jgi:hypothetical protein
MAALYQIDDDGSRAERWEIDEESVVVGRKATQLYFCKMF